jgi:hypothetical protein
MKLVKTKTTYAAVYKGKAYEDTTRERALAKGLFMVLG